MTAIENPVILIPARLASTRFPRKPLAEIGGEAMIVHVWRRAIEADLGPVFVACADGEIARVVKAAGGDAVMTGPDHPSGSDRIFEALGAIDAEGAFDAVINVQGDLMTLDAALPRAAVALLDDAEVDIGTLAAGITDEAEIEDPNVVKAVVSCAPGAAKGSALYFSRAAVPSGAGRASWGRRHWRPTSWRAVCSCGRQPRPTSPRCRHKPVACSRPMPPG